jgi:hypothetical protein
MSMDGGSGGTRTARRARLGIAGVVALALAFSCGYPAVRTVLRASRDCNPHRPVNITQADLAGTYAADDGGRVALNPDGTSTATRLNSTHARTPLSGSGSWKLLPDSAADDIYLTVGTEGVYLSVAGSRSKPWLYWVGEDLGACEQKRLTRV